MSEPNTQNASVESSKAGYAVAALAFIAAGVVIGQLVADPDVMYTPIAGVSAFSVLYVIAQGSERVTELFIGVVSHLWAGFADNRKKEAVARVRTANSTLNGNPSIEDFGVAAAVADAAEADKKVADAARSELTLLAQGLSFALCYVAVCYFQYGIFIHLGVSGVTEGVDRVLTALAATGGSKGLHDLISKVQKSKEATEEKAAA